MQQVSKNCFFFSFLIGMLITLCLHFFIHIINYYVQEQRLALEITGIIGIWSKLYLKQNLIKKVLCVFVFFPLNLSRSFTLSPCVCVWVWVCLCLCLCGLNTFETRFDMRWRAIDNNNGLLRLLVCFNRHVIWLFSPFHTIKVQPLCFTAVHFQLY